MTLVGSWSLFPVGEGMTHSQSSGIETVFVTVFVIVFEIEPRIVFNAVTTCWATLPPEIRYAFWVPPATAI